jgi:L-aspartate oxidase
MKCPPAETDFLVIGAGVAGLRAAIELAAAGRVVVLDKREVSGSAMQPAQGGTTAALSDEDEIHLHLQDTLSAGNGLSNADAVKTLLDEAPERIEELIQWGTEFDPHGTKLVFARESTHNRSRVLHAPGDSAGREILRALYAKARTLKNISLCEFEFSTDLQVESGRVRGIYLLDDKGEQQPISASAVLLAAGGLGQLYRHTTNPAVATADGVAMAFVAGAEINDMEFVQFHPTALYLRNVPRWPLSEALEGEGAYLRNIEMVRFMPKYHPMAELAPRDLVARAIVHELEVSRAKDPFVYLDLTHLNAQHLKTRLPRIYATCMQCNIDITTDLIPIRPAAHYAMGGVHADLDGRATLPGLYAAGEAAATGVHGANRLASNSLLEGLVFGARAGKRMREDLRHFPAKPEKSPRRAAYSNGPVDAGTEEVVREAQDLMWQDVGIVRTATGLKRAVQHLENLTTRVAHPHTRRGYEARNLHIAGLLVARSALAREESRGAHYRTDFPAHDDVKFLKHSVAKGDSIRFA